MRDRLPFGWLGAALVVGSVFALAMKPDSLWGADGIWNVPANGDWSDAGNWSGGIAADGSSSTAFFNIVDVPTVGVVVSLDAPRTIGQLTFGDINTSTAGGWTLAGPETLTLAGTSPTITVGALGTDATATIAAAIAGSDGLTKAGAGTLTLSGSNSYTGGTTVSAGTLKGTIDSIRGDVSVNAGATVEFQNPASSTIANKITGDGVFRVFFSGGGHVWINGLADFTGTVQLSKAVANGGKWTASGIGTLDAALIVDDLCQIYVASPTAFNKGITVSGIGNTENRGAIRLSSTLGGDITLAGDTTVGCENGTIAGNITSGAAGTQTLTFAGAVTNRTATVLGSITDGVGAVALTQNLTGGTLRLAGDNSYSGLTTIALGTVQVGTGGTTGTLGTGDVVNDGALVFNRSNDLTVANQISGTGSLSQQGAGILTLTGSNSYTGATTVDAGTLLVTGSLGQTAVTVNGSGTLGGSGAIGGSVMIKSAGALSPGTSTGVLGVGQLTLESGSTTWMEIDGVDRGSDYDGIDIADVDSLIYGGTLSLSFGNTTAFDAGTLFDLFAFDGAASGALAEVTSSGYYAGDWEWDGSDAFSLVSGGQTLLFQQSTGNLTIVPEPSTMALVVLVLLILGACRLGSTRP